MPTIVLAMHGAPPKDYPHKDLMDFFKLHMAHDHGDDGFPQEMHHRHEELHNKMRKWPRTAETDPFWDASRRLAEELSSVTGNEVIVGFNEFCGPSIDDALEKAVQSGADEIIVITPMMTPGGEHSEIDIPRAIKAAEGNHPQVSFRYAWPFDRNAVATFLAEQLLDH
ncbi:MAG: sirohydrochlorin chelatase [Candidatus Thorarchaeota archaeon]|jgi:sirohydrochlorin cobaltochelatase